MDHVIVYDNASDTGTLSAPRAWLMFRVSCSYTASMHIYLYAKLQDSECSCTPVLITCQVFGHEKVSVLDGGLPKWIASGYPTVSDITPVSPTNFKACYNPVAVYSMEAMLDNFTSKDHSVGYVCVSYLKFLTEHDVEL